MQHKYTKPEFVIALITDSDVVTASPVVDSYVKDGYDEEKWWEIQA